MKCEERSFVDASCIFSLIVLRIEIVCLQSRRLLVPGDKGTDKLPAGEKYFELRLYRLSHAPLKKPGR
jgi:hypothetical protein